MENATDDAAAAAIGVMTLVGTCTFALVSWAIVGFVYGKILEKAGKPLWVGWVPIYNLVTALEIVGRPAWFAALFFIPPVAPVMAIILALDIAAAFGKDTLFAIGMMIPGINVVMIAMLAFGDAKYIGPPNRAA